MFDIQFETEQADVKAHVWQNSWGITTRTIGVMIMTHADDKGMVLPPRVANVQVVVIPIPKASMAPEDTAAMHAAAKELEAGLKAAGVRTALDARDNYTPGWKYNYWELRGGLVSSTIGIPHASCAGVPVRIEIGPKDMATGVCVVARRDTGAKTFDVPRNETVSRVKALLETIQVCGDYWCS